MDKGPAGNDRWFLPLTDLFPRRWPLGTRVVYPGLAPGLSFGTLTGWETREPWKPMEGFTSRSEIMASLLFIIFLFLVSLRSVAMLSSNGMQVVCAEPKSRGGCLILSSHQPDSSSCSPYR